MIWIECTSWEVQRVIRYALKTEPHLSWVFSERTEVQCALKLKKRSGRAHDLDLRGGFQLSDRHLMHLHVEEPDKGGSACGLLLCTTITRDETVDSTMVEILALDFVRIFPPKGFKEEHLKDLTEPHHFSVFALDFSLRNELKNSHVNGSPRIFTIDGYLGDSIVPTSRWDVVVLLGHGDYTVGTILPGEDIAYMGHVEFIARRVTLNQPMPKAWLVNQATHATLSYARSEESNSESRS
ncbi:hypothetical protein DL767_008896 [Monosporascus sp. MG133]|nr:hypothetical protein DL767_008896 [Monosporascus sp. MG133]